MCQTARLRHRSIRLCHILRCLCSSRHTRISTFGSSTSQQVCQNRSRLQGKTNRAPPTRRSMYAFNAWTPRRRNITFHRRIRFLSGVWWPRLLRTVLGPPRQSSVSPGDDEPPEEGRGRGVGCRVPPILTVPGQCGSGRCHQAVCIFIDESSITFSARLCVCPLFPCLCYFCGRIESDDYLVSTPSDVRAYFSVAC